MDDVLNYSCKVSNMSTNTLKTPNCTMSISFKWLPKIPFLINLFPVRERTSFPSWANSLWPGRSWKGLPSFLLIVSLCFPVWNVTLLKLEPSPWSVAPYYIFGTTQIHNAWPRFGKASYLWICQHYLDYIPAEMDILKLIIVQCRIKVLNYF